ncbi:MAG: hypothetical protein AAB974_00010, partial [Patescibacteria group bacterium]
MRSLPVGDDSKIQLEPFQRRMVPDSPTALHIEDAGQVTPFKSFDVPELLDDQLEPFQRRMVPDSPTAKQSELVTQYTPFKSFDVPELLDDQLEP